MEELHFQDKTIMFGTYTELNVDMANLCFTVVYQDEFNPKLFYIAFDQKFIELSPTSQKFLLFHEMGHIKNNDFDIDQKKLEKQNILRSFGISNRIEFKADKFAVEIVGKKAALKCLIEMKCKNIFTSSLELIQRAIVIIFG